jgi:hypothetical protein
MIRYRELRSDVVTLIKPSLYSIWPTLFNYLNCIPSASLENKGIGMTAQIVSNLKSRDSFIFMISPKGTRFNKEWRTGWYYIAKELDLDILVIGLNYNKHRVEAAKSFETDIVSRDRILLEQSLKESMKPIHQLNPEYCEYNLPSDLPLTKVMAPGIEFIFGLGLSILVMWYLKS